MSVPTQSLFDEGQIPTDYDEGHGQESAIVTAEKSVLGGMILSPKVIAAVAGVLRGPGDFHQLVHQTIYRAILDMYGRNARVDPILLGAELEARGEMAGIDRARGGGHIYLSELVSSVPIASNAEYYADQVRKAADLRALVSVGTRLVQIGNTPGANPAEALDAAMSELQALAVGPEETEKVSVADRLEDYLDRKERGTDGERLESPWGDLNEILYVRPGMFGTVGAATSGGKSLFAQNWASHVALKLDKPVLFGSLEMSGDELMDRLVSSEAAVPLDRVTKGGQVLTEDDWNRIGRISDRLANAHNFVLDDSANLTLSRLRARIRAMASQGRMPALVVVDYLQLMPSTDLTSSTVRAQQVAELSRGLKLMAMEFQIAVIALAQFNRAASGRRPAPTDFKESSAIEQDSNFILLLHTELDEEGQPVKPGEVEVIVAKNRQGPKGRVLPMAMQGHYARIKQMAH